jgi:hypothetical protein
VTYQGIIYTIWRRCSEAIGSGKNEATLLQAKKSHFCLAVTGESDYDGRILEERSRRSQREVGEYLSELFPENFGLYGRDAKQ